jgi:hypothetical protein
VHHGRAHTARPAGGSARVSARVAAPIGILLRSASDVPEAQDSPAGGPVWSPPTGANLSQ